MIINKQEKKEEITIYERKGNFFWMEYSKRQFNVTHFRMRENQEKIIDDMSMYYINSRTNNCTSLIYGEPGSGKSMIPILLAKKWMSTIVRTFNPSEPGDSISSLYNEVNPSEDKPLIIVLDEVDIMIDKIHHNKIIPHKHIPTQVQDKTSWNRFLDDFNLGLFPYVILVLTSNLSADSIKIKYDPSYIREGRVNISIQL